MNYPAPVPPQKFIDHGDYIKRDIQLCRIQGFLDYLKEQMEAGEVILEGNPHAAWHIKEQIDKFCI